MIEDRIELNKNLNIDNFFPPFFSVLIPSLGRPYYTLECIDHLHENGDMPVEIIVHDDGSGKEKQTQMVDKIIKKSSTIILNCGYNAGLAKAFNRCRLMASSKYLLGFNDDTYLTSSSLRNIKAALELPYVGIVNLTKNINPGRGVHITKDGVKIAILKGTGNCHLFGMRSEVWDEIGGWDENVQTTASDVGFTGTLFGAGYFAVAVEGTQTNEMWPKSEDGKTNTDGTNPEYIDAAQFTRNDNNVPPIFNMNSNIHKELCENRRCDIWRGVNDKRNEWEEENKVYPSWYNSRFNCQEISKLYVNDDRYIDWEFAKTYGHDKWKDQIIKDFNI